MSEFKLFDRGFKDTVLFIPGWAADYRIFNSIDIDANYLMPLVYSPFDFDMDLLRSMNKYNLDRVSVIGWSMGGFIGHDLLLKHKDRIADITFVGVRKEYTEEEIESSRNLLKKNRAAFLYRFYSECFSKEEGRERSCFKNGLMRDYLNEMNEGILLEGLQYLSSSRIKPQVLRGIKTKFIHGLKDRIAPVKEVMELKEEAPDMELITIKDAGHIPFLKNNFKEICRIM
jgi:pimeloyl-ACP methyl ester carboxylesterase